jgi:hypothetical protein
MTGPPRAIVLPLDTTLTAPPVSARPPPNVSPSNPLMALPPAPPLVTRPEKLDPVSPLPSVTLLLKVAAPPVVMPERVCKVLANVVAPAPRRMSEAPVPSPRADTAPTAPLKVALPVPELTVRS